MRVGVSSSFDVALWFLARAEREQTPLPPGKLHGLLFYAQAYYAGVTKGRRLMPSVFVATEVGPRDPNLYRLFENGIPAVETDPVPEAVARFLERIWFEFGPVPPSEISRSISESAIWREVYRADALVELTAEAMHRHFGRKSSSDAGVQRTVGDRIMAGGRMVEKWRPSKSVERATVGGAKEKTKPKVTKWQPGKAASGASKRPAAPQGEKEEGLSLADLGFGPDIGR